MYNPPWPRAETHADPEDDYVEETEPRPPFQAFGLRVQGSGIRDQGLGFRVQGLGFRVQGLGCRV